MALNPQIEALVGEYFGDLEGAPDSVRGFVRALGELDSVHSVDEGVLYRELFEGAADPVFVIRGDCWEFVDSNPDGCARTGFAREEIRGARLDLLFPGPGAEVMRERLDRVLREGPDSFECDVSRQDGSFFPCWFSVLAAVRGEGEVPHLFAFARDVSERRRVQANIVSERERLAESVRIRTAQLSEAAAKLARAEKLKDEFLAGMSHELRTPLHGILGQAQAMKEGVYGDLAEKQQVSVARIQDAGSHLLDVLSDILDVAKIGAGEFQLVPTLVDVRDLCEKSLAGVEELAERKSLELTCQVGAGVGKMYADGERLEQVVTNLVSNAVKFTEDGSVSLGVEVDEERGAIVFEVRDTGIGIEAEDMSRLFKPFVQLDSSLSRQHSGTGLGLSLVYYITEMHGGGVVLRSVRGEGATFSIELPLVRELGEAHWGVREAGDDVAAFVAASEEVEVPCVLVADDNEANLRRITEALEGRGYRLLVETDSQKVLDRALVCGPDLILYDVNAPIREGAADIEHLKAERLLADVPIVAMSAMTIPGDRERCLEAGATEFLTKPIACERLMEVVGQLTIAQPINQHTQ